VLANQNEGTSPNGDFVLSTQQWYFQPTKKSIFEFFTQLKFFPVLGGAPSAGLLNQPPEPGE